MNDIKVICCDLDGTLLLDDHATISEQNKYWIKRAVEEKGVLFTIVSGRMLSAVDHFYDEIGVKGASSCLNGCALYGPDGATLASRYLDKSTAKKVVELRKRHNMPFICISDNLWYAEDTTSYLSVLKRKTYRQDCIVVSQDEMANVKINKFVCCTETKDQLTPILEDVRKSFDLANEIELYYGDQFIEIMPSGVTKGTGIDDLMAYYKLSTSQIMAIGDDMNDIDMLKKVKFSVAMANGLDCAKEVASYITDTNTDDGVAKAIRHFLF